MKKLGTLQLLSGNSLLFCSVEDPSLRNGSSFIQGPSSLLNETSLEIPSHISLEVLNQGKLIMEISRQDASLAYLPVVLTNI